MNAIFLYQPRKPKEPFFLRKEYFVKEEKGIVPEIKGLRRNPE